MNRECRIQILLTSEEKDDLVAAAELADDSVSAYVRRLIIADLRRRKNDD